ncbi:hypothetical protein KC19_VG104000 [Ceratodon purpureus]|uniref:Uncharacterized protein n=1 Tax=Ceratodon purpureus TaxID=3225 RepID=A0A8T0H6B4_CERPU|nr:hypothetical protein KC19_8G128400 [Ceratodon purpureus]KAG0572541.1 hypothetical protein KC19_VG104000 [Ceratodon purpureus]
MVPLPVTTTGKSASISEPVEYGEPALEPERIRNTETSNEGARRGMCNTDNPVNPIPRGHAEQDVAATDNLYRLGDTTNIILHRQQQVEKDVAYLKDSVSEILDQFKGFQSLPTILGQVQSLLSGRRQDQEGDKDNGVKISEQNSFDSSNLGGGGVMVSPSPAVHILRSNPLKTTEDSANCDDDLPDQSKNVDNGTHICVHMATETTTKIKGINDPVPSLDRDAGFNPNEKEVAHTIEISATARPAEELHMQANSEAATKTVSSSNIVASNSLHTQSQSVDIQKEGTVTPYSEEGTVVVEPNRKPTPQSSDPSIQTVRKKSKFEERAPPATLTPNGHQRGYPMGVNKDVWVIHPTRGGGPVALGKTGYSFKTTKAKLQASPWRSLKWEVGMQLVEIKKVYQTGVKVMHPTQQPQKNVKTLDDVTDVEFSDDALVMWGSDYLVEVSAAAKKKKKIK